LIQKPVQSRHRAVGAWPTAAVQQMTRLALLRIRFKLTVHARKERLLGRGGGFVAIRVADRGGWRGRPRTLECTGHGADLAPVARDRFIAKARRISLGYSPDRSPNSSVARKSMGDHARLRAGDQGRHRASQLKLCCRRT
jgi:hypothetical protein